ncbi:MAG: hypothetical protein EXS51_02810 [Candidatus Taylorbacteria bacterium]|nr:hypothetical protein [Candidatus Taylorbacteria bacterium]
MENRQYEKFLEELGLNKEQSLVYEAMLKNGLMPARMVAQKSGIKRSLTYKILEQLISLGLVEKRDNIGKITFFFPAHPGKLREFLQKREEAIKTAEASLGGIMGRMVSDFNLLSGKPNVQFYEGPEGMKKVLEDSLTAESEIYSYSDVISVQKYIPDLNTEYMLKRKKFSVKKKILFFDSPEARKLLPDIYRPDITEYKFISFKTQPPHTVMQIYDNKVSYITLGKDQMIGVIIEDANIYSLHKYLFENQWNISPELTPDTASLVEKSSQ